MMDNTKYRPFIKWPGNKFRCLEQIIPRLPKGKRLIEPFMGSGSVFLNSDYIHYILGEKNPYLIQLFKLVQEQGPDFIQYCAQWFTPEYNQKEKYYALRDTFNQTEDQTLKAALLLYLNRHGYNGLCRFNSKGIYNVPFGLYLKPNFPEKEMLRFHQKTKNCDFIHCDYQQTFAMAKPGDVIYCDPPYHPISKTAKFTLYTKGSFDETDQAELARLAESTSHRGIHVLISNHDTEFTRNLYQNAQDIYAFDVQRSIASRAAQRVSVKEVLAYFPAIPAL